MNNIIDRIDFTGNTSSNIRMPNDAAGSDMRSLLLKYTRTGDAVTITLNNGKELRGTIAAYEETILLLDCNGNRTPVTYTLIGTYEKSGTEKTEGSILSRLTALFKHEKAAPKDQVKTEPREKKQSQAIPQERIQNPVRFSQLNPSELHGRRGHIEFFVEDRGFGFIRDQENNNTYYFGKNTVQKNAQYLLADDMRTQRQSQEVIFDVICHWSQPDSPTAVHIRLAKKPAVHNIPLAPPPKAPVPDIQTDKAEPDLKAFINNKITLYLRSQRQGTNEQQKQNCYEAEKWLLQNKEALTSAKGTYYTFLIQIYERLWKLGDETKLLSGLDEAIASTLTEKTCLYFMMRKANILRAKSAGDLRPVIETLNQWIQTYENFVNSKVMAQETLARQKILVLSMAGGYIRNTLAKNSDYTAPSPLKERIEQNRDALEKMREDTVGGNNENELDQASWNILLDDFQINISPFVKSKLEGYNLTEKVRIDLLDNNRFIGTVAEATQEYKRIVERVRIVEPLQRFDGYLRAARILYDALMNDELNATEEERTTAKQYFFFSIGKSFISYGDYAVKNPEISLDTARYYYYEGLKYIIDERQGKGQDKQNAATRLISSFFLERQKIPLPTYAQYGLSMNNLNFYKDLPRLISKVSPTNEQIVALRNFFFQNFMDESSTYMWILRPMLFSKANRLFWHTLLDMVEENLRTKYDIEKQKYHNALKTLCQQVNVKYKNDKINFIEAFEQLKEFNFKPGWLSNAKSFVGKLEYFKPLMLKGDIECLDEIMHWVSLASEYNDNSDCEKKSQILNTYIVQETKAREDKINQIPSRLTFENMLPVVQRFREVAAEEFARLCETKPPDICIELSGEKEIRINEGKVLLQINIRNSRDCMAADSLTFSLESTNVFTVTEHDTSSVYVRGGESRFVQVTLELKDESAKVITVPVSVGYTRKVSITDDRRETKEEILTVQLTSKDFKPIDNPYRKYAGGGMVLDEKMFFGRKEFIDGIITHLTGSDGMLLKQQCILLYGQTRTGKSSILAHLKTHIQKNNKSSVVVDIGDMYEFETEDITTLFPRAFCKKLKMALTDNHVELLPAFESQGISFPDIEFTDSPSIARAKLNDFLGDFTHFLEQKPLGKDYNIIVMIDEFTTIYSWIQQGRMNDDFMYFWKAFINDFKLVGILAGKDTMPDFIDAYKNPFAAIDRRPVTYLPDAESERMIKAPPSKSRLVFGEDTGKRAVKRIKELTANSAWFNMILLDRLVEYMNEQRRSWVSDADIDNLLKQRIFAGPNPLGLTNFDALYNDGDQKDLLRQRHNVIILWNIANSSPFNGSFKQGEMRIPQELSDEYLDAERIDFLITRLIQRDVIERDNNDILKIKVGLFYEWLKNYCSPKTINDDTIIGRRQTK